SGGLDCSHCCNLPSTHTAHSPTASAVSRTVNATSLVVAGAWLQVKPNRSSCRPSTDACAGAAGSRKARDSTCATGAPTASLSNNRVPPPVGVRCTRRTLAPTAANDTPDHTNGNPPFTP